MKVLLGETSVYGRILRKGQVYCCVGASPTICSAVNKKPEVTGK
jgi:hypothetical protein